MGASGSAAKKTIAAALMVVATLLGAAAVSTAQDAPDQPKRSPWVGLRVKPLPEALAAHLAVDHTAVKLGHGLMVVNVVIDSPADRAGLHRYDVITQLDGQTVTDQLSRFVQVLGRRRPGDHLKLTVIRGGDVRAMTLTVGASEPALDADYEYRYEEQPSGIFEERTDYRGTVLTKGADGWEMSDFAQLDPALFNELPEAVRGKVLNWAGRVVPGRRTSVVKDGQTIEVIRDATGTLTVRKSMRDEAGQERVAMMTYASPEGLKAEDPDAFELYTRIITDPVLSAGDGAPPLTLSDVEAIDPETPTPEALRRTLADAELYQKHIRAYEKFLADYARYLRNRLDEDGGADQPMPATWRELLDRANREQIAPEREFSVDGAGRIDVRIRKSTGDLVISFRNEQEMQEMYPRLYDQYRKLVEGEE